MVDFPIAMVVYRSVLLLYAVLAWLNLHSSGFLAPRLHHEQASPNKWTAGEMEQLLSTCMGSKTKPFKGCCFWRFQKFRSKEIYQLITLFQSLQKPTSSCLDSFITSFHPSKQPRSLGWKKKTGQKPSHEGVLPLVCQGTGDFGDAQNTKNSMLPAASETNAVGIAIVAVGLEPAKIHCIHVLLRFFFTPLVLGTIIVKGKQEKGTSQFVGLVFHNIYFLGIKGKQQKGIESKLQNAHALCLHTLAPCSIQRRRASAKRRQAVHMCQGPRRAIPGSFYGLAPRKLAISILHSPSS